MRKFMRVGTALVLSFGLFALAGCGEGVSPSAQTPATGPAPGASPEVPAVSPLAALDDVDLSQAFGDTEAEDWSYALGLTGTLGAAYRFRWTSEVSDTEKFFAELGADVTLRDVIGLRSSGQNPLGVDLFGGGNAGLSLRYTGPKSDAVPVEKTFDAGFRHDGDWVVYADKDGNQKELALGDLRENLTNAIENEAFARMAEAVESIPEDAQKGLTLRLCVENLIDLGFTAEVDETDGLTVRLRANTGFYTDLINDLFEEFLPADWLPYIPRADLRYRSTEFEIVLSFYENGLFRSYSMSSDIDIEVSLEVRGLFACESGMTVGGGMTVSFYDGEVPAFGPDEGTEEPEPEPTPEPTPEPSPDEGSEIG